MSTIKKFGLLFIATWTTYALGQNVRVEKSPVPAAHGMYVHASGVVWLADTFKKLGPTSFVYDLSGKKIDAAASGTGIGGISKHPHEDLFSFCDTMGSKLIWRDSTGKNKNTFDIENPWNARWTPSGDSMFVVTYGGSVVHIDQTGQSKEIVRNLDAPFDIAPIGEDEFWVSEQGVSGNGKVCLYKQTQTGEYKVNVCNANYDLQNPEGLSPLKDGSVAAVDTEAGTLVKIRPDGAVSEIAKGLGIPILVQLLNNGDWVVFTNRSSVGPAVIFGKTSRLRRLRASERRILSPTW